MKKFMRVGIRVVCAVCGQSKAPIGRSISALTSDSYCHYECDGYRKKPYAGSLFPNETEEDFGFPISDDGTEWKEVESEVGHGYGKTSIAK